MKYIGDQRTRTTGASGPFTPVRTRLDIDEDIARQLRQYRMYRRLNDALVFVMGATFVVAVFAVIYHVSKVI